MQTKPVRSPLKWSPLLVLALAFSPGVAGEQDAATDWPQFRGLQRSGVAAGKLAASWPEHGPRQVWQRPLGSAFSQLVVAGDGVYTGSSGDEQEYAVRLDAATGKDVWRVALGELFTENFGNGPRSTPTVANDTVYMLGARGRLVALQAGDGKPIWSVELTQRFESKLPRFGYSESPLVVDDLLLVSVGGEEGKSLAALDRKTGETRWTALAGPVGYSSPLVTTLAGVRQVVAIRAASLTGFDLEGKVLWDYPLPEGAIGMPLVVGQDRVFVSASGDSGCWMLEVARGEDGSYSVTELWSNRDMRNHFNSSVLHDGYIYGFDNATLKCLDAATGELKWAHRGLGKGSLLVAGDRLVLLGDRGKLVLAEASPAGYRELGTTAALTGKSWTAPSFARGRVYLRNLTEAVCLELGG